MKKSEIIIGKEWYCDFETIQSGLEYLEKLPEDMPKKIFILSGIYNENVHCYLSNVTIIGLGQVEIIGDKYAKQRDEQGRFLTTFRTATFFLEGKQVLLKNLVIRNNAGPGKLVGQAVALFNHGHQIEVRNCTLSGYQDTLCVGPLPKYQKDGSKFLTPQLKQNFEYCVQAYHDCLIEGSIDFIFGGAEASFFNCELRSRRDGSGGGYITAASTPMQQEKGLYFYGCYLSAEKDVNAVYLGRPWRPYAKTHFEKCWMGKHITESGWNDWENKENRKTVVYLETENYYKNIPRREQWINYRGG